MRKTDTETLIAAMKILARDIQSCDGVANAAIAEAADRLAEHLVEIKRLNAGLDDLLSALKRIEAGEEMTGVFTYPETVLLYQGIARAAIAKVTIAEHKA